MEPARNQTDRQQMVDLENAVDEAYYQRKEGTRHAKTIRALLQAYQYFFEGLDLGNTSPTDEEVRKCRDLLTMIQDEVEWTVDVLTLHQDDQEEAGQGGGDAA